MILRWVRLKLKLRRIGRLQVKARSQFDALPTRQLRRQAQRRARKILGDRNP